jgi:multiple sugar transport system substrate-binding protein
VMVTTRPSRLRRLSVVLLAAGLVAASCGDDDDAGGTDTAAGATDGGSATTTGTTAAGTDATATTTGDAAPGTSGPPTTPEPVNTVFGGEGATGDEVTVRWFVGLGTGAQPEQLAAQRAVVESFNEAHDDVHLEVEIIDNEIAFDTLSTQIAAGNAPDIIGPIGIRGSNAFAGQFLDLEPLVESTGFDLSQYDPEQVEFWREETGELTALPFGVFPAMMYYNKDLFDEADLEYPPAEYEQPYADGDPWDMDKVAELAKILTVDANGNDATSPEFDPENVVQWGFHHQFNDDARAIGTFFGPGSFVAEGGSAQIPENWLASWQWYVDLIASGAAPNQSQIDSDTLGQGNSFATGNVAMSFTHLWYTCCVRDEEGNGLEFWDIAAVPEYEGVATAKLHADTFRVLESTENPEAAFEVLSYLLGDAAPELLETYGGLPARADLRDPFFASLDELFPQQPNWEVAIAGLERPDIPSHEGNMPNFDEAEAIIDEFETRLTTEPGLDVTAAAEQLRTELDPVFRRS